MWNSQEKYPQIHKNEENEPPMFLEKFLKNIF